LIANRRSVVIAGRLVTINRFTSAEVPTSYPRDRVSQESGVAWYVYYRCLGIVIGLLDMPGTIEVRFCTIGIVYGFGLKDDTYPVTLRSCVLSPVEKV
jgi:hypothetical protein